MITRKTVLVLGAGASMDYGFPSGQELKDIICSGTQFDDLIKTDLWMEQISLYDFRDWLLHSDLPSIDAILEKNPSLIPAGRVAIAAVLLPLEKTENLFDVWVAKRRDGKRSWYQHLFASLADSTSFEDFGRNLSIVTFNYDRSIEHYLFTALQNTYPGKRGAECAEKLKAIKVIHVYGKLGTLPWEGSSDQSVSYDFLRQAQSKGDQGDQWDQQMCVRRAAQSLEIINESETETDKFRQARKLLKEAEKIYFLGFGYHPKNLERLQIDSLCNPAQPVREIWGTSRGLSRKRIEEVENYKQGTNRLIDLYDTDVYDFLYKQVVLD